MFMLRSKLEELKKGVAALEIPGYEPVRWRNSFKNCC